MKQPAPDQMPPPVTGTRQASRHKLTRVTFQTSRELDFFSEKELAAQTGHPRAEWPAVVVKELVDNGLDACEEHDIAPRIVIAANAGGITVADNGPGLPESALEGIVDFTKRASSREAYCSPTRGAQGNALKTLLGMPYVLAAESGRLAVSTGRSLFSITCHVDQVSQQIRVTLKKTKVGRRSKNRISYKSGTSVRVEWGRQTDEDGSIQWPFGRCLDTHLRQIEDIARGYSLFNPHSTIIVDWFGNRVEYSATDTSWRKWTPNQPTSPHWYDDPRFERLVGAYITHDRASNKDRTIADFIAEFDGLSGNVKRAAVLEAANLKRAHLSDLANSGGLKLKLIRKLLSAMKAHTAPVTEKRLGQIGRMHITQRLTEFGCKPESIRYKATKGCTEGIPFVMEAAFGAVNDEETRQIHTGVNWSPGIKNPFRSFGTGDGLEAVLSQKYASSMEPIVFTLHVANPCISYTDRGKSAIVIPE